MKVLQAKSATLNSLLPADVMTKILEAGTSKAYEDGELIQERGDTRQGISIVNSGRIVAGNIGLDGSFLISALLHPGECFGEFTLFAGLPRTQTLWAQGRTEITHISGNRFMSLYDEEPAIARALLTVTLLRNHEMMEFIDVLRRMSLAGRLARLLLTGVDTDAYSGTIECRHEDLESMLGVSRVSVGKALKRLEADELVSLEYGRIHLLDIPRLKEWLASEDQLQPLEP